MMFYLNQHIKQFWRPPIGASGAENLIVDILLKLDQSGNVISSKWQVALMAPTEILAKQHYDLALKVFKSTNIKIEFLTGKSELSKKKLIQKDLLNGKINFLIGTHALFQKNILFKIKTFASFNFFCLVVTFDFKTVVK